MQDDLRVSTIILPLNQPTASCPVETVSTVDVVMYISGYCPVGVRLLYKPAFS